ncbi:19621_t:CDS:1 [Cetraspora pellucida]|uniref:19621_t:CDS:1 n=1 Tax=Cetraspora pellucida TaxID=1433469 RepID=A0A9N9J8M4_9GLOM|nr:19621_t:CDS:1 [Cetraspora pellucida]
MAQEIKQLTATSKIKRSSYNTVAEWVKQAWDDIDIQLIQRSFKCCGISVANDGSEENLLFDYDLVEGYKANEYIFNYNERSDFTTSTYLDFSSQQHFLPQSSSSQDPPFQGPLFQTLSPQSSLPSSFPPQSSLPQSFPSQSSPPQSSLPQSSPPQSLKPQSFLSQNSPFQSFLPQGILSQSFPPQKLSPQQYLLSQQGPLHQQPHFQQNLLQQDYLALQYFLP